MALPRVAEHFGSVLDRDQVRAIPHLVINHHDDFAGPAFHTFQGAADAMDVIAGDDADTDR